MSGTLRHDPQCLLGSLSHPGCAARRLQADLSEARAELELSSAKIDRLRNMVDRALKILLMATPTDMPISKENYNPISAWVYEAQQLLGVIAALRPETHSVFEYDGAYWCSCGAAWGEFSESYLARHKRGPCEHFHHESKEKA